jgi:hypothetical protein
MTTTTRIEHSYTKKKIQYTFLPADIVTCTEGERLDAELRLLVAETKEASDRDKPDLLLAVEQATRAYFYHRNGKPIGRYMRSPACPECSTKVQARMPKAEKDAPR